MNALELAEWLENHVCGRETTKEVIAMLRQQQADKLEYAEAVVEALEWGNYAGDYFQQKHGWHEDVAKWNDIVAILKKAQEK